MNAEAKTALYPGSFDPLTLGHVNIVNRACRLFDRVYVAVAKDSSKHNIFTLQERTELLRSYFSGNERVQVVQFAGLLVEYAKTLRCQTLIRGIRTVSDFEYELIMAQSNRALDDHIETLFIVTEPQYSFISSTMVREIARLGGDVSGMAPPQVVKAMRSKLRSVPPAG